MVEIADYATSRLCRYALEQQIQSLQPSFKAACLALNTDKISLERAIITRKLTPGQWTYSPQIGEQEAWLKQLKREFQQLHEPTSGRDVTWAILTFPVIF